MIYVYIFTSYIQDIYGKQYIFLLGSFHGAAFPVSVDPDSMPLFGVVRKRETSAPLGNNNNSNNNRQSSISFKGRDYRMLLAVAETLNFTPAITITTSVTQVLCRLISSYFAGVHLIFLGFNINHSDSSLLFFE